MLREWFTKHRALSPLGPAGLALLAGAAVVAAYVASRPSGVEVSVLDYKEEKEEDKPQDKPKVVPYLPSKVPWIGNMLELAGNAHRFHSWMAEQCIAHNGVFKLHLPGQSDMLVTAVPEHYEHVVKTQFEHFSKGHQQYDMFVDLMGHSVLIIEGERWKYHRRLLKVLLKAAVTKKPVDVEVPGQNVQYAMGITIGMRNSLMMHIEPVTTGAPAAAAW
ncbi:hypothetical protein PF011_g16691 [Phytophthora fragariae]|nr:hypothetical protein PF011_g16691 [Phytophthora fragariae]